MHFVSTRNQLNRFKFHSRALKYEIGNSIYPRQHKRSTLRTCIPDRQRTRFIFVSMRFIARLYHIRHFSPFYCDIHVSTNRNGFSGLLPSGCTDSPDRSAFDKNVYIAGNATACVGIVITAPVDGIDISSFDRYLRISSYI